MSKQTSAAHPPIPLGCEHFYEREVHCTKDGKEWVEKQWFFLVSPCMDQPQYQKYVIEHEIGLDWKMPEPHRRQARTVIAAVAEVGWLKEAEYLEGCVDGAYRLCEKPELIQRLENDEKAARDNARAWREWGAQ